MALEGVSPSENRLSGSLSVPAAGGPQTLGFHQRICFLAPSPEVAAASEFGLLPDDVREQLRVKQSTFKTISFPGFSIWKDDDGEEFISGPETTCYRETAQLLISNLDLNSSGLQ